MPSLETVIEQLHHSSGVPLEEVTSAALGLIEDGALPEVGGALLEHDCALLFLRVLVPHLPLSEFRDVANAPLDAAVIVEGDAPLYCVRGDQMMDTLLTRAYADLSVVDMLAGHIRAVYSGAGITPPQN